MSLKFEYLSEFEFIFKWELLMEKTRGEKSLARGLLRFGLVNWYAFF
jgi:hypothetical protein